MDVIYCLSEKYSCKIKDLSVLFLHKNNDVKKTLSISHIVLKII